MIRLDQSSFSANLDDIDRWLQASGFHQRDRLRVYRANIAEMVAREQATNPKQLFTEVQEEGRLGEILSSYAEGIELVDALTTLREKRAMIPHALLRKVLDGPADASREDHKSNQGRNAMFELSMGAMLAKQDLHPIFGLGNPDLEFRFQGRRVLMECKRILSEKKILSKISEAVHQLERCVHPEHRDIGLIALSVSRLAHQGNGYWGTPTVETGRAFLSENLHHLAGNLNTQLARFNCSHAAGIIFYISSPLYVECMGYTVASEALVYPMNVAESHFLRDLANTARL